MDIVPLTWKTEKNSTIVIIIKKQSLKGTKIRNNQQHSTVLYEKQLSKSEFFCLGRMELRGRKKAKKLNEELWNNVCHRGDEQQMIPVKLLSGLFSWSLPSPREAEKKGVGSSHNCKMETHPLGVKILGDEVPQELVSGKTLFEGQEAHKKA